MDERARRLVGGVVLLGGLALVVRLLPVAAWLTAVVEAAQEAGPAGAVVFSLVYAAATVAFLPVSLLTVGAGLVYGPVQGFLVVWPAAVAGAVGCFVLGRTLLRDQVQAQLASRPTLASVVDAVTGDGATLILLLRLSPIFPFNILNYGLGLTGVPLRTYTWATAVGIVPGTFLYIYLGSTLTNLSAFLDGTADSPPGQQALYWGGLLATLAVTVLITRRARAALHERLTLPEEAA